MRTIFQRFSPWFWFLWFLELAFVIIVVAAVWIYHGDISQNPVIKKQWNLVSVVIPEIVNPILSLLNLISPIIEACVPVENFFRLLIFQLFLSIPSGTFVIVTTFMQNKNSIQQSCTNGVMDPSIMRACSHTKWFRGIVVAFTIAGWVVVGFQLYDVMSEGKEEKLGSSSRDASPPQSPSHQPLMETQQLHLPPTHTHPPTHTQTHYPPIQPQTTNYPYAHSQTVQYPSVFPHPQPTGAPRPSPFPHWDPYHHV